MKSRCSKITRNGAAALFAGEWPEAGSMAQKWQVRRLDVEAFEDRAEIALTLVARSQKQRERPDELKHVETSGSCDMPQIPRKVCRARQRQCPRLPPVRGAVDFTGPHIFPHFSTCHQLVFFCTDVCVAWPLWPGLDMRLLGLA